MSHVQLILKKQLTYLNIFSIKNDATYLGTYLKNTYKKNCIKAWVNPDRYAMNFPQFCNHPYVVLSFLIGLLISKM